MRRSCCRRTTLLSLLLLGTLAGIGAARWLVVNPLDLALFMIVPVIFCLKWRIGLPVALCLTGALLGFWRGSGVLEQEHIIQNYVGEQVIIQGIVASDGVYGDKSQMQFDLDDLQVTGAEMRSLAGRMAVKGYGENMIYKGDVVEVKGTLYASRGSRQTRMSFAKIKVLSRSSDNLTRWRRRFEAGMLSALPEPLGSFGLGLLIGQRSNLPLDLNDALSKVGLTHIVAVSGYNLTIIVRAVRQLFAKRSKYQATLLSLTCITLFMLCTGFSASIVRAAFVSVLSLWAWYYGRSFKPILLIALVASLTALINPFYLWSDIGWYLSMLAFFGVLVVGPELQKVLKREKEPGVLGGVIIETFAAQLMTAPIIMHIFGRFSLIALLSNLLVVPLVSLAMLLCCISGLAGTLVAAMAGWVSWPARYLLTYMIDVVRLLARLSWASFDLPLSLAWMLTAYAAILLVVTLIYRKNRGRYVTICTNSS